MAEATAIEAALDLTNMSTATIIAKVTSYITLHLSTVVADVKVMNTAFDGEQYNAVGVDACKLAQAIFTSSMFPTLKRCYINAATVVETVVEAKME